MFRRSGPVFMNHHAGHPWLSLLMLLLIIVAVALAAIAFWRTNHATTPAPAPPASPTVVSTPRGVDPALAELRLRYARGEIDHDEYVQRAANLGDPPPASGQGATT